MHLPGLPMEVEVELVDAFASGGTSRPRRPRYIQHRREELANWRFIKERDKPQELRDHLARFPKGVCLRMVSEKLEALLWRHLGEAPTIEALNSFLEEFPESAHAAEAQALLDELEKVEAEARAAEERGQKELADCQGRHQPRDIDRLLARLAR
jgi:hypothetical protein